MDVILTEDVRSLGKKGEKVKVSDGYARNYLFPRKLAQEANSANLNVMQTRKDAVEYKAERQKTLAAEQKKSIDGKTVFLHIKAGANGKLFGAITSKEIAEALTAEFGKELTAPIDKKKVVLSENIKNYGDYTVEVKLYPEISATVTVRIGE